MIISTDDDAECRNVLLLRSVCDQENHPPVSHCVSITTMRVISKMSFEPLTIHLHHKIPTKREALSYMEGMIKVARNEVKNASFAQRCAHRDSRIWRPELIEPAAERK